MHKTHFLRSVVATRADILPQDGEGHIATAAWLIRCQCNTGWHIHIQGSLLKHVETEQLFHTQAIDSDPRHAQKGSNGCSTTGKVSKPQGARHSQHQLAATTAR